MGDSKRRKESLGEKYGQEDNILPGIPIKPSQARLFSQITTRGAWIGIALLVVYWVVVRFVGPSLGWWELN
ncbi:MULTISPECIES: DUF2839 domain-containing protein [Cyanophyceae]|uniref:DUF2839 domain-containing protein n=1 Tax=Cyanophyceae TaxID=3028117 RepID=UPI00074D3F3D|nr:MULTISPECIES: DUF2839 domain-containing protein [Cyanophyceae]MBF2086150.1 DUF2839 domain-containing protein [Thermoleptolyngbya sp. C42_A2020_037]BAU41178.1 hypothetical protein O77CONTIG1_00985 [Leptolyngbya sp. O-77]